MLYILYIYIILYLLIHLHTLFILYILYIYYTIFINTYEYVSIYSEYQICENKENLENCLSAMLRADEGKMRGSNLGGNLSRAFEFERCKFTEGEGEFLKSW